MGREIVYMSEVIWVWVMRLFIWVWVHIGSCIRLEEFELNLDVMVPTGSDWHINWSRSGPDHPWLWHNIQKDDDLDPQNIQMKGSRFRWSGSQLTFRSMSIWLQNDIQNELVWTCPIPTSQQPTNFQINIDHTSELHQKIFFTNWTSKLKFENTFRRKTIACARCSKTFS